MKRLPERSVTAFCGDLMLAKECVANLRVAGFLGEVRLVTPDGSSEQLAALSYGDRLGELPGRGLIVGGLLGLVAGSLLLSIPGFGSIGGFGVLALVGVCTFVGALLGGAGGWKISRNSGGCEQQGRLSLRCLGSPGEAVTAYETLQRLPCWDVTLDDAAS